MALTPAFGSIKPSQKQQLLETNFLSFNGGTGAGDSDTFAQQYLPEIYEQEVERLGNRTLSGFLRMVGAEMPMTSDQVIWSEQNRLHVAYNDVSVSGAVADNTLTFTVGGAGDTFVENVISANQTIVILDTSDPTKELKALVTASSQTGSTATLVVAPYSQADLTGLSTTAGDLKIFVYGSEYAKGSSITNSTGATDTTGYKSITPSFTR